MRDDEQEIEIKVGDLVVYTNPYQYLSRHQAIPFGLVIDVDGFHVNVAWTDGETYLESVEDLKIISD